MSGIILPGADGQLFQRDRDWHPKADTPGYKSTTFRAPKHSLLSLGPTKSEMTGPTFGHESWANSTTT
jgi:protocatechuate 3,4-dioxygenase beta subunit